MSAPLIAIASALAVRSLPSHRRICSRRNVKARPTPIKFRKLIPGRGLVDRVNFARALKHRRRRIE
eukprot:8551770-Pyramimonas_sp.AAC.1